MFSCDVILLRRLDQMTQKLLLTYTYSDRIGKTMIICMWHTDCLVHCGFLSPWRRQNILDRISSIINLINKLPNVPFLYFTVKPIKFIITIVILFPGLSRHSLSHSLKVSSPGLHNLKQKPNFFSSFARSHVHVSITKDEILPSTFLKFPKVIQDLACSSKAC